MFRLIQAPDSTLDGKSCRKAQSPGFTDTISVALYSRGGNGDLKYCLALSTVGAATSAVGDAAHAVQCARLVDVPSAEERLEERTRLAVRTVHKLHPVLAAQQLKVLVSIVWKIRLPDVRWLACDSLPTTLILIMQALILATTSSHTLLAQKPFLFVAGPAEQRLALVSYKDHSMTRCCL